VIAGSFLRPVGGYLADRFGGQKLLLVLFTGAGILLGGVSWLPPVWVAAILLAATMGLLGMGNGAVFQVVPQRFPKEIGVLTGLVGAAGGIGGFFLPNLLGLLKKATGSYGTGFAAFAATALFAAVLVRVIAWTWDRTATTVLVPTPAPAEPAVAESVV
jgi:NNP family nitrate/nitrite transporter-like MFS transporter